ncbi:MAG: hypothetical protein EB084_14495 [Proteobacteria bacterium]|nr:hypothetical protein [Pseudomonadota bacterium]
MQCPRDGCALDNVTFMSVEMDTCAYCDSAWLDAGELRALHHLATDLVDGLGLETHDPRGTIKCPSCAVMMQTRYFSDARRVVIDRCPQCAGIWLDSGELKIILNEAFQRRTQG